MKPGVEQGEINRSLALMETDLEVFFGPLVDELSDDELATVLDNAVQGAEFISSVVKRLHNNLDPKLYERVDLLDSNLDDLDADEQQQVRDLARNVKEFAARYLIATLIAAAAQEREQG